MSLGDFKRDSPGSTRMPSPNSYNDWLARDFPDDLLLDSNFDQPLTLTPEEERLFRSFGDGMASSLGSSFESDPINERQVVFAEAQAAGLFKGGIRRAAFSMSDLQALQAQEHPSPPSPSAQTIRPAVSVGASKPPRLESVPESKALPASSGSILGEDLLLNTRVSGLSVGGSMSDSALDGLALDQLSNDLLGDSPSNPFESHVPMSIFEEGNPSSQALPASSLPQKPSVKTEPGLGMPPLPHPMDRSQGFPAHSAPNMPGLFDFSLLNGGSDRKPPLPPSSSSFSPPPLVNNESAMALQGYADELLGSGMPQMPQVSQPGTSRPLLPLKGDSLEERKERMIKRSQSAVELRSMGGLPRHGSTGDLQKRQFMVELTTPEGHTYTAGRLSNEERAQKILRYRQKRHERNFNKRIKYMCRKTLADSRPRVRGRFARNDDAAAVMPHETKKALAEKARKEKKEAAAAARRPPQPQLDPMGFLEGPDFNKDFSALIPEANSARGGFSHGGFLPSGDDFDFPAVPMELYGHPARHGPPQ